MEPAFDKLDFTPATKIAAISQESAQRLMQLRARVRQCVGHAKESAGRAMGNRRLEVEGLIEEMTARIDIKTEDARRAQFGSPPTNKNPWVMAAISTRLRRNFGRHVRGLS